MQAIWPIGGVEVQIYPSMTMALEGGEGSASHPSRSLPLGKDPALILQEAGWATGPVWTGAENLAPQPGFDPRTVQAVVSCYTDYATWPTRKVVALIFPICPRASAWIYTPLKAPTKMYTKFSNFQCRVFLCNVVVNVNKTEFDQ